MALAGRHGAKINRIDATLFAVTVLAWGTTWYVILGQFGVVHPIVSVGGVFTGIDHCAWDLQVRGERLALTLKEHALCAILGLFLFCLNYGLFYTASLTLTTGLISVVFSTMVFWNALGSLVSEATIGLSGSPRWWDWCLRFDHFVPCRAS